MSAFAAGIAASTTRAPSRSSSPTHCVGGVARLGLAPVAELGRAPEEADREPVEPGLGRRRGRTAPTRAAATSSTLRAIGPTVSSVGTSGKTPSSGSWPHRGFRPTVPQAADGQPDRAARVGADPEVDEPRRERGGVAGRRAARRLARVERVVDGPVPRVGAEHAPRELGQVGLADDDRARRRAPAARRSRGRRGRGRRRSASRRSCGCPRCRSGP